MYQTQIISAWWIRVQMDLAHGNMEQERSCDCSATAATLVEKLSSLVLNFYPVVLCYLIMKYKEDISLFLFVES